MEASTLRHYVTSLLARYWGNSSASILDLPVPEALVDIEGEAMPPRFKEVVLPEWASACGVDERLLVPVQFVLSGDDDEWSRVDWFSVIFWYSQGVAERAFEKAHGPIHSYSFKLQGWDDRIWQHAWVNRIALFLRCWAAKHAGADELVLFGELPEPEILITHDLDAIRKTVAIRFKQTAFNLFNTCRAIIRGDWKNAAAKFRAACRFLFSASDYDQLAVIAALEEQYGIRSQIHVYGGQGSWQRSFKQLLFDPSYSLEHSGLISALKELAERGWDIGLHQSFCAWNTKSMMSTERKYLMESLGLSVTSCRQHWLRFSWVMTWQAQEEAGLKFDTTLGFNDRPGFRNASALKFCPWDFDKNQPMKIEVAPLVLMDSHLYDYYSFSESSRQNEILQWINEIRAVHGTATLLWHPHTLSNDYSWRKGFDFLLNEVSA